MPAPSTLAVTLSSVSAFTLPAIAVMVTTLSAGSFSAQPPVGPQVHEALATSTSVFGGDEACDSAEDAALRRALEAAQAQCAPHGTRAVVLGLSSGEPALQVQEDASTAWPLNHCAMDVRITTQCR